MIMMYPVGVLHPILAFVNASMLNKKKAFTPIILDRFSPFLCRLFWLCFHSCSVADLEKHWHDNTYPNVIKEINRLSGNTTLQKIHCLNELLRAFNGGKVESMNEECGSFCFDCAYGIN